MSRCIAWKCGNESGECPEQWPAGQPRWLIPLSGSPAPFQCKRAGLRHES